MKYMTITAAGIKWGISYQMVRKYLLQDRIPWAIRLNGHWKIPESCEKPISLRVEKFIEQDSEVQFVRRLHYEMRRNIRHGIYEYLQVNAAYSSNRMAGNRLERKLVEQIFESHKIINAFAQVSVEDLIETENHFAAVKMILKTVRQPLTIDYVKELHYELTAGTIRSRSQGWEPGEFRTEAPKRYGEKAAAPEKISQRLNLLIKSYEHKPAGRTAILNFHVEFEEIRPFDDFNGRVGRVILLKECLRHRVTPFIIGNEQSAIYNRGIAEWKDDPAILKTVVTEAQDRFLNQIELWKRNEKLKRNSCQGSPP